MKLGVLTFALESSGDPARLAEKAENLGFSSLGARASGCSRALQLTLRRLS